MKHLIFPLCLLMTSCDALQDDDFERYIQTIKSRHANTIVPPKIKHALHLMRPFDLTKSTHLHDPFEFNKPLPGLSIDNDSKTILNHLSLSQIQFVGTLEVHSIPIALIKGPDPHIHPVKLGDIIGKNKLTAIKITTKHLVLEHPKRENPNGEKKTIRLVLGARGKT